ncbi:MAG: (4Fe-4S)-binding protein [Chitinophagaceae bacterium]
MERDITKKYSNGEVTVVWKPKVCIHSTICWKAATGLPEVFNPSKRPWIELEAADTERIVDQVKKCPSGALSYYYNNETKEKVEVTTQTEVEVTPNGPLLVYGNITIRDAAGNETKRHKVTAFCRCGHSQNKPYCDGSHVRQGFNG